MLQQSYRITCFKAFRLKIDVFWFPFLFFFYPLRVEEECMCAPVHLPNTLLDLIHVQEIFCKLQAEGFQVSVCYLVLFFPPQILQNRIVSDC